MATMVAQQNAELRRLLHDDARPLLLKDWRESRGYTQRDLAQVAGCAVTTLNEIETGKRPPRLSTLRHIARVFEILPQELWDQPQDPRFEMRTIMLLLDDLAAAAERYGDQEGIDEFVTNFQAGDWDWRDTFGTYGQVDSIIPWLQEVDDAFADRARG